MNSRVIFKKPYDSFPSYFSFRTLVRRLLIFLLSFLSTDFFAYFPFRFGYYCSPLFAASLASVKQTWASFFRFLILFRPSCTLMLTIPLISPAIPHSSSLFFDLLLLRCLTDAFFIVRFSEFSHTIYFPHEFH